MKKALYLLANLTLFFQVNAQHSVEKIEQVIATYMEESQAPGLSVLIKKKNWQLKKAYGYANLEKKEIASTENNYKIASVTKPMTAVAVMQLCQQGKVDLDDEIQKYVPTFPLKKQPVTVRQLLAHTSGISHYKSEKEKHFKSHKNTEESINIFKDWKLTATPGKKFTYSSYGYILLGALIENVSGMPYEDYMKRHVWAVSGMTHTGLDNPDRPVNNQVEEYFKKGKKIVLAEHINISSRFAAGGVRSTVSDLNKFARGIVTGAFLNEENSAEMLTSHVVMKNDQTYALGWNIKPIKGEKVIFHSGAMPQTSAHLMLVPSRDITIILLSNLGRQILQRKAFEILDILLEEE